jgi:NTP pyrophosphatase (non-canonical NTP hydrolase)
MGSSDQDAYDEEMGRGKYSKHNGDSSVTTKKIGIFEFQCCVEKLIQNVGDYNEFPKPVKLMLNCLAMAGEAGEIANKVKKHIWYPSLSKEEFKEDIKEEIGDVLYHLAQLSTELDINIQDCLGNAINKAERRNK